MPVLMKGRLQIAICKYNRAVVKVNRLASFLQPTFVPRQPKDDYRALPLGLDFLTGSDLGGRSPGERAREEPERR